MRTIRFFIMGLTISLFSVGAVSAHPVDAAKALKAAENFLLSVERQQVTNIQDITSSTPFSEFYVFTLNEGTGFIIVSGDDCVTPILGYSLNNAFRMEKMPDNVMGWLQDYESAIRAIKEAKQGGGISPYSTSQSGGVSSSQEASRQWDELLGGGRQSTPNRVVYGPLLQTTWDQSPYYNSQCPYASYSGTRPVTGCVATATAQIMKYWEHPTTGYGSHSYYHDTYGTLSANFGNTTYSWSSMPNALSYSSSNTQVNAVAKLMQHVGVAMDMDYGVNISSAYNINHNDLSFASAENALVSHFKYSPSLRDVRRNDYSENEWKQMLIGELSNQHPILYDGSNSDGGHSFVCDGYNSSSDLFHINWGWGSYCDGWFVITGLDPEGSGTGGNSTSSYNQRNTAILGIQPNNSFNSSTTVSVYTNNSSYGSVTGGGSYSFNDTIYLRATANTGYRFRQWSDGNKNNGRYILATGGTISLTAQFEPLSGDTLSYCTGNTLLTNLGTGSIGTYQYWGIRLPHAILQANHDLRKVQFYASDAGTYELTVYLTSTQSWNIAYTATCNVDDNHSDQWNTITLTTPVAITGSQDVFITFRCNDVDYPAAMTYSSGNNYGLLFGSNFSSIASNWDYSAMIKGIFQNTTVATGDTVSYCGDSTFATSIGAGGNLYWGISLPPSQLVGRNYLQSVLLYVNQPGTYDLNVYSGNDTTPVTLLHYQTFTFNNSESGYQSCILDNVVSIDQSQHLWVTFHNNTISYPAAACNYVGDGASNWVSTDGSSWMHLHEAASTLLYSWMIKCVTSSTVPVILPNISIGGPTTVYAGIPATFNAIVSTGANVTWSLPGATPSSGLGGSVTATWNTAGTYTITATATNSNGTSTATHTVNVTECSPVSSFPHTFDFNGSDPLNCWTAIDGDGDGYGWMIGTNTQDSTSCITSASYINNIGVLTPNNWIISPAIQLPADRSIRLSWDVSALDQSYPADHYGVYISTTGIDTADFILLGEYTIAANGWTTQQLDLNAFAGNEVHLALRHFNCTDQFWMLIDNITLAPFSTLISQGNCMSYCGDGTFQISFGAASASQFYWGIKIPHEELEGRSYLDSVTLYIQSAGNYTLNIYQGGVSAPGTLTYSQSYTFGAADAYQACIPSTPVVIDTLQDLWITFFNNDVQYPATACSYAGDVNSDWYSVVGTTWAHLYSYNNSYSWMIKCFASSTQSVITHQVTVSSDDPAMGSVTGGGDYEHGQTVTINASAAEHYHFSYWQYTLPTGTTANVLDNPYIFQVTSDISFVAFFEPDIYTVEAVPNNSEWGTVTGGGDYAYLSSVTLTATPAEGYHFVGWSNGTNFNPYSFPATDNVSLTAIFDADDAPVQYFTVTVTSENQSMGTVSGGGTYEMGTTIEISATPLSGYEFFQWNDGNNDNPRSVTVTCDLSFTAQFAEIPIGIISSDKPEVIGLYPNPANAMVIVTGLNGDELIEVISLTGSVMISKMASSSGDMTLDVSQLTPSIYLLRVTGANGTTLKRLVRTDD